MKNNTNIFYNTLVTEERECVWKNIFLIIIVGWVVKLWAVGSYEVAESISIESACHLPYAIEYRITERNAISDKTTSFIWFAREENRTTTINDSKPCSSFGCTIPTLPQPRSSFFFFFFFFCFHSSSCHSLSFFLRARSHHPKLRSSMFPFPILFFS